MQFNANQSIDKLNFDAFAAIRSGLYPLQKITGSHCKDTRRANVITKHLKNFSEMFGNKLSLQFQQITHRMEENTPVNEEQKENLSTLRSAIQKGLESGIVINLNPEFLLKSLKERKQLKL